MIEKFAKQGMLNGAAKMELLQAAEEAEQEMAELQEALSGKDGEREQHIVYAKSEEECEKKLGEMIGQIKIQGTDVSER